MPNAKTSTRLGPWLVGTVKDGNVINLGATTVSQEFICYQPTATAGSLVTYRAGRNGVTFGTAGGTVPSGNAINVPNQGAAYGFPVILPAGSRIQTITYVLEQAPTAITTGLVTISLVSSVATVALGTLAIGTSTGFGSITFGTTLPVLRAVSDTGLYDATITATLSGTGITGGLLMSTSVNYTVRNYDGSIPRIA